MKTASADSRRAPQTRLPPWSGRRRYGARQSSNGYEIVSQGPCRDGELKLRGARPDERRSSGLRTALVAFTSLGSSLSELRNSLFDAPKY